MRIAIDFSPARVGGGVIYANRILAGLARLAARSEYLVWVTAKDDVLAGAFPENVQRFAIAPRAAAFRVPLLQAAGPLWLQRHRVDVLVSPFEYSVLGAPCPVVLGMQNAIPYMHHESVGAGLRNRAIRSLAVRSARRAAKVFFPSEAARGLISERMQIPLEKTAVIPHGIDVAALFAHSGGAEDVPHQPGINAPYLLSVSSVASHKDFESLFRAFADLIRGRNLPHRLLIAGTLSDTGCLTRLRHLSTELQLEERVDFLGDLPHGRLGELYQRASVVVLPSRAETFGLPLLEAMACGAPVVASDLPALREVAAHAALFYSPGDAQGLREQLGRVLAGDALRASMVEQGSRRAQEFSWGAAAQSLLGLIQEAEGSQVAGRHAHHG